MEAVHKVCYFLKKRDAALHGGTMDGHEKCLECPAKQKTSSGRSGTKMCYLMAQECMNVARWGNPWGEKYEHSKAHWPEKKQK